MAAPQELTARDSQYAQTSLEQSVIFCGDERGEGDYIHIFGGALNIPYNLAILKEVAEPGSVTDTFEDQTASLVPVVADVAKVKQGVHSDDTAENAEHMHTDRHDGPIGCGYAEKRQAISQLIHEMGGQIVARAAELAPELFQSQEDDDFADEVVNAHGRLAERSGFFTTGRRVALVAVQKGAETQVVKGEHTGEKGELNMVPNTSLRSEKARQDGEPLYSQDEWAVDAIQDRIRHLYPYDRRHTQIAHVIDAIGTMAALGVDLQDISVRRPPSADIT